MYFTTSEVTGMRHPRCPLVLVAVLTVLTCLTGCRTERSDRPTAPASATSPRCLGGGGLHSSTPLSVRIKSIATAYALVDTAVDTVDDSLFDNALDSAAHTLLLLKLAGTGPEGIIAAINRCLFEQWGISFSDDRNNVRYLLPHLVWREKKGSCAGMSLLYLLLAEKAGIPLHAVRAPSHLFVRYENGPIRRNIETLRGGEDMSEAWYRMRYSITDTVRYPLRNLNNTETAAVVAFNLGTICLNRQRYADAIRFLGEAIAGMPDFPEAQGNLALAFEAVGDVQRALGLLLEVRHTYPLLENIDRTIASLQLKSGDYRNALASFEAACEKVPDDPEAHYGRAITLIRVQRIDEAFAALDRAIKLRPDFTDAERLLLDLRH